jgi:hypothetical protein
VTSVVRSDIVRINDTNNTVHLVSADMKECQETTVCHEAMEADIGKMEPFDRMIAILEQMIVITDLIATTDLNGNTKEMECEKPASVDTTPEVAHEQEVPVEDAEVMPVGEPRKRRRDERQILAVVRSQKKEKRIHDTRHREKQRDLVTARRGATHRAAVAQHRITSTKDTTREYFGPQKGLVAALRGTTRRVQVARRNILSTKNTT